ncbi:MAG: flagellar biosynthesis protein FlhF [Desulfobulbaceae bacterium]|nr:flagellar biosynthesis protein FlhF [Desulfobulbaceae bacterium]
MQVKVFEASDMNSGLKKVKEALGPDALILSTRTLRNGRLGVLGKPILEITAAIDSAWEDEKVNPHPSYSRRAEKVEQPAPHQGDITYQELWDQEPPNRRSQVEPRPQPRRGTTEPDSRVLSNEISELRSIINGLSQRIGSMDTDRVSRPYIEPEYVNRTENTPTDPVVQLLRSRGINQQVAELVSRFTRDSSGVHVTPGEIDLNSVLTDAIAKLFTVSNPLAARPERQKRICLVGPTGVGKTTTIAKLAAGYLNTFRGKVALITIDTYRIAAVEQLKVYGEIMNLPVEVVIKPRDFELALARHSDCDLILIDTAGRSPGNTLEIEEMASFLGPEFGLENHLLLSATSREAELEMVISRFSCLPISHLIFSKVDECSSLGVLLNIHYKYNAPIAYLTNGQRVPEDIIAPDPRTIAELILNNHRDFNNG